jgi:CRP-like cAMP-binding protein
MAKRRPPFAIEPRIAAIPFGDRSLGRAQPLLTTADKAALTAVGKLIRVPKGVLAYRSASAAENVYNLVEGVLKTFQVLPNASTHISGFHFPGDLFGLAEQGKYVDSAEAVVSVAAYEIPRAALETLLVRDGGFAVRILCKFADELRKKNRHALILDRQDAVGKLAMFLLMVEDARQSRGPGGTVYFPMTRVDVGKYVGLTLESVSRAFHLLERLAVVKFIDRHHFHVLDRVRLEALSAGTTETIPTIASKKAKTRDSQIETEATLPVKRRGR